MPVLPPESGRRTSHRGAVASGVCLDRRGGIVSGAPGATRLMRVPARSRVVHPGCDLLMIRLRLRRPQRDGRHWEVRASRAATSVCWRSVRSWRADRRSPQWRRSFPHRRPAQLPARRARRWLRCHCLAGSSGGIGGCVALGCLPVVGICFRSGCLVSGLLVLSLFPALMTSVSV